MSSASNSINYQIPTQNSYVINPNVTCLERIKGFREKHNISINVITAVALLTIVGLMAVLSGSAPPIFTVCAFASAGVCFLGTIISMIYNNVLLRRKKRNGYNELHIAIMYSKNYWLKSLLSKPNNNLTQKSHNEGYTPLQMAVAHRDESVVLRLLSFPEVIKTINERSERVPDPLDKEYIEVLNKGIEETISNGGDPDKTDTALHIAVREGYLNLVKILIAHGADKNIDHVYNKNVVDFAEATYKNYSPGPQANTRKQIIDFLTGASQGIVA